MTNETQETTPATPPPAAIQTVAPKRAAIVVDVFDPNDPVALYMNTGLYEQVQRVALLMSRASLVPAHLRSDDKIDRTSDCFLVASQAFRWRMDPFAVAQHTFVLSGKLGYEGKLIAAVINTSGRTSENLRFEYFGTKGTPGRGVRVIARLKNETEDRTIEGTVGDWRTQNQKWKEIEDQMLSYRGSREWARRHAPEVLLGVQSEDEIIEVDRIQSTPTPPLADARLVAAADKLKGAAPVIPSETVVAAPVETTAPVVETAPPADTKPASAETSADDTPRDVSPAVVAAATGAEPPAPPKTTKPAAVPLEQDPAFLRAQARGRRTPPADEGQGQ